MAGFQILFWGLLSVATTSALCPYMEGTAQQEGTATAQQEGEAEEYFASPSTMELKNRQYLDYVEDIKLTDWDAVRRDIDEFLTTSQDDVWPADFGNYGPLFVRLAWHNAGSYRTSDGRGGVDGARQRFDPERSWDDNTNLDKARTLLFSVKEKHPEVSWGDLIVLTGSRAIQSMGGPEVQFCAGRIDDDDGSDSLLLGPSTEQEQYAPCALNGTCQEPLGSTTIGLIYLNPQGPLGVPDSYGSSLDIRDSFGRMSMNDSETVALIGGGHTFGKAHGACPEGAGPSPRDDPLNAWPGLCGSGKGVDTFTSGIEGAWTTKPTTWDNEYFQNLLNYDWTSRYGPGGAWQWGSTPVGAGIDAPSPLESPTVDGEGRAPTMMMTSDIALTTDADYNVFVEHFALTLVDFEFAFSAAWYKLMTRDMGPVTRCATPVEPQDFQHPLPASTAVDYVVEDVTSALKHLYQRSDAFAIGSVVKLAYACASTFRYTDYLGGCNGARILMEPARSWPSNGKGALVDAGVNALQSIFDEFKITWSDLIVLAGGVALDFAATHKKPLAALTFCPGRGDDSTGEALKYLEPPVFGLVGDTAAELKEYIQRTGLTNSDYVALLGARRSLGDATFPFSGNYTTDPAVLDNGYFKDLLANTYDLVTSDADGNTQQYKATNNANLYAQSTDIIVKYDAELNAIAQQYSIDNDAFLTDLAEAWTKLMNADRFDSPDCLPVAESSTLTSSESSSESLEAAAPEGAAKHSLSSPHAAATV